LRLEDPAFRTRTDGRRISCPPVIHRLFASCRRFFVCGAAGIPGVMHMSGTVVGGVLSPASPTMAAMTAMAMTEEMHGHDPANEQQDQPVVEDPLHHSFLLLVYDQGAGGVLCLEQGCDGLIAGYTHRPETGADPLHGLAFGLQLGVVVGQGLAV